MSMVLRGPDGQGVLLIKGADNVMLERASRSASNATLVQHLLDFSNLGLRTLVLGQRYLSTMEVDRWHIEYKVRGALRPCVAPCLATAALFITHTISLMMVMPR